jgi:UDP-N-acetylglucosamine 2-epimerase
MKILRVLAPDADPSQVGQVRDAVQAFNRGLDIRLRFLAIVVEDRELQVDEPETAAETVGAALAAYGPSVVLVQGADEAALAAATVAAREDVLLARLGAGSRDGPAADVARAVDHLCGLLIVLDDEASASLASEGLADRVLRLEEGPDLGDQVIKALRAERVRRRGDTTC